MAKKIDYDAYEEASLAECLARADWRIRDGWKIAEVFCPRQTRQATWCILLSTTYQEGAE